ncbi:MAG TPA: 4-hydroxythreonine-4-phosphate dehydrogenase PdxA [Bacteroidia bacterium]|nr:4-hydroxythreonine-4-phosphate dehydrogenase PdxA [Bacteroidia bacterium]HOM90972.1 4-hydroxythreonine-4-phosphate dehydrogenase PdxA [Bacteroidia bacterium]
MSTTTENEIKPKIGITIGDLNGVGIEVIIKTFSDNRMLSSCTPVIYGSSKVISYHRKSLHQQEFNFNTIRTAEEASNKKTNVINCWEEDVKIELGKPSVIAGTYAFKSLEAASKDVLGKKIDAIVTAPIDKSTIHSDAFPFNGHTEYFAKLCGNAEHVMLMVSDKLRVGLITGHVALKDVPAQLTKEKIISKTKLVHQSLRSDFGLQKPRIAILALNPHAGDNGLMGKEEQDIITPAISELHNAGIGAFGPYPADGFFGSSRFKSFDAIMAIYHDQGLVPFKALAFSTGVNYTAGLPIIRTSPDHGTAYDLAGKNQASEESFREAVYLACDIAKQRQITNEITANPLKFSRMSADR